MRECEIKAACSADTLSRLEGWLRQRGFAFAGEQRQEDDYYDHPQRSFALTDEALRLRRSCDAGGERITLAYKGPNTAERGQNREELETAVGDAAVMAAALQHLGFKPAASVHKTRRSFEKDDVTVCLDRVDGLGCFFEIEILGAADAARRLELLLAELAFLPFQEEKRTYLELL